MQNEDWKPSPNKHRDKNGNPLTAQAQKIDKRTNSDKQLRVRNNKKLAGIRMKETLQKFGNSAEKNWGFAAARARSADLTKGVEMRKDIKKKMRETIVRQREQRITNNQAYVSVENVTKVHGFFPLNLDGKVKMKSLRFTELIGFVAMQLKKRNIPYDEAEDGSTKHGIIKLKEKLVAGIKKENSPHKLDGDTSENIKVMIEEGETDFMGVEWSIEKVYSIIESKNNKR